MNTDFCLFLKCLHVRHTKAFSDRIYNEHPYKYTMFGWADLLDRYNIDNTGFKLQDKDEFLKLECPFLAHLGDRFVIVKHAIEEQVDYEWNGQTIHSKFDLFKQMWTGNVLCAYPNEHSEEVEYAKHRNEEKREWLKDVFICTLCSFLIIYAFFVNCANKSAIYYLLLLINAGGLYISYLLLLKQLHIESRIADRFCTLLKQSSCHDLLDTKASKFFNLFGWSELGAAYFSANLILLLSFPSMFPELAFISFCSLAYPVWSISYQYLNKQWCTLCLCIQFILIAQFVTYLLFGALSNIQLFDVNNLLSPTYIISLFVVIAFYMLFLLIINKLDLIITKSRLTSQWKQTANSLKMKNNVFKSILKEQKHFNMADASNVCIGNSEAKTTLSIFSNPYCNPCASMHARIDRLLEQHGIHVQYIFTSFNEDLAKTNRYLIACYQTLPQDQFIKILREWYTGGKQEGNKFFKNLNLNIDSTSVDEEFIRQQTWTKSSQLHATPTLLLDGYLLPTTYEVEDVSYFLDLDIS